MESHSDIYEKYSHIRELTSQLDTMKAKIHELESRISRGTDMGNDEEMRLTHNNSSSAVLVSCTDTGEWCINLENGEDSASLIAMPNAPKRAVVSCMVTRTVLHCSEFEIEFDEPDDYEAFMDDQSGYLQENYMERLDRDCITSQMTEIYEPDEIDDIEVEVIE